MPEKLISRKEFKEKATKTAAKLSLHNIFKLKKMVKIYSQFLGNLEYELFDETEEVPHE